MFGLVLPSGETVSLPFQDPESGVKVSAINDADGVSLQAGREGETLTQREEEGRGRESL